LDAAKTLVKGSRNPKDKTLLMAIQGYFVSQGALLLPLSTILEYRLGVTVKPPWPST